jgi:uncharacterized protein (DUF433 family)
MAEACHFPLHADANGDLRVGQSRVLLDLVVQAFDTGATPETIVRSYPTLVLADVYAVVSYYLQHRGEVEEHLRRRDQRAEEIRQTIEASQSDMTGIRARLLARQATPRQNDASGDRPSVGWSR